MAALLLLALGGPAPASADLLAGYSPAERLGGELTVRDLQAPPLSPLALAEQGRLRNSNDPLEGLPLPWRTPLRQLLPAPSRLRWQRARRVHASWAGLRGPVLVPLVLHSDGTADVFLDGPGNQPLEQALTALLERLGSPPAGTIQPLLLELQPRPGTSPSKPSQ